MRWSCSGMTRWFLQFALLALGVMSAEGIRAERLAVKVYTTSDGLGHNEVYRIVCDSRGFLWFCTFEGLSRFDGYGFTTFGVDQGLPSSVVNDLLETREGVYWVATASGLCRFNPKGIAKRRARDGEQESAASNAMFRVYFPEGVRQAASLSVSPNEDEAGSRNVTKLLQD